MPSPAAAAASPPLPLLSPSQSPQPPAATAGAERSPSSPAPRNSMLLSSTPSAEKRLSTASNPSRNPPTPNQPPPAGAVSPSPSFTITASPSSSPSPPGKHRIPSFPPPQASRISIMSTLSSNRDSFHPQFTSSLSYASVRDFAYPSLHPLHYGPSPASGISTPAGSQRGSQYFESGLGGGASSWFTGGGSGYRRLSDPAHPSFDFTSASTSGGLGWGDSSSVARQRSTQVPPLNFSDGPPWSEDEDLQSPVVMPKHRKHKSSAAHLQSSHHARGQSKNVITPTTLQHFAGGGRGDDWDGDRRSAIENGISPGGDYYTTRAGRRTDLAGGEPGDELYNHPEGEEEYDPDDPQYYSHQHHYSDEDGREYDDEDEGEDLDDEDSRFSRDYQFTIASPDEEMHGKAVALFDFTRENENELPLVEGQVVWVSYRHGMGWLVAEDPKTGESGLIPEEYVRLLRDLRPSYLEPIDSNTMTPSSLTPLGSSTSDLTINTTSNGNNGHNPPIISTFSTSSQDVHPYPYQFHYPTDHPPDNPHHIRRGSLDLTGGETPTIGSNKERIALLQREQERAVAEESSTPRLRSGRFDEDEGPHRRQEHEGDGGKNGLGIVAALNGDDVYYDAPERQGDGRSELDFRGKVNEKKLQVR